MALFRVRKEQKILSLTLLFWVSNIQHRLKFSIQKLSTSVPTTTTGLWQHHRLGFCWDACLKLMNECVLQGEPRCLVYLQFFKGWKTKFQDFFCQNKITPSKCVLRAKQQLTFVKQPFQPSQKAHKVTTTTSTTITTTTTLASHILSFRATQQKPILYNMVMMFGHVIVSSGLRKWASEYYIYIIIIIYLFS